LKEKNKIFFIFSPEPAYDPYFSPDYIVISCFNALGQKNSCNPRYITE